MSLERRTRYDRTRGVGLGSGVYVATVISTMDPTFMGRLKVTLLREQGNDVGTENQTYVVTYASPFFGYTPYEAQGKNKDDFNDSQKSYGMWMVPPDVGVKVLCMFVDGDPGQGFWFACVPANFANHMVPAIGASLSVEQSPSDKKRYNTSQPLPVAEINKEINADEQEIDPENINKAVHPIADRFLTQGILEDDARGTTVSTARRTVPNNVFGISTPGPLDYAPGSKRMPIGTREGISPTAVPVSRLGGTQFVMDDGDDRFTRKTAPDVGPVEYADVAAGEKGIENIPYNEHTRIRTRTGHQILMHNSEDLIYIGNSKGTAWVELTSNGKIDIYAADSISIHSENDLNIRADRDVNIEGGRNVNIKATAEYASTTELHRRDEEGKVIPKIQDDAEFEAGRVQIESAFNTNILIGANGRIETRNYKNSEDVAVDGDLDISVIGSTRFSTGYGNVAPHDYEIKVSGDTLIKTTGDVDINTDGHNWLTAGATTEINSGGDHIETAPNIHMNGPTASTAAEAAEAQVISDLITHDNVYTDGNLLWNETKYQSGVFNSIMKRIPMHEPWLLHENQTPNFLTPSDTDREASEEQ